MSIGAVLIKIRFMLPILDHACIKPEKCIFTSAVTYKCRVKVLFLSFEIYLLENLVLKVIFDNQ